MRTLTICLALLALPVAAQDTADAPRDVPLAEWRDLALGNSVHYSIDGTYIGREFYLPDGRSVRYEDAAGNCQDGWWTFKDDVYCFAWPGSFVCARHLDLGDGRYLFPSVESDGTPIPDSDQEGVLVAGGFTCGPGVMS